MYHVITGGFHCNQEDGAMGTIVSSHRSEQAAERVKDAYSRRHTRNCTCGGGRVATGTPKYGKLYLELAS